MLRMSWNFGREKSVFNFLIVQGFKAALVTEGKG